jgi:diacylglycerol kinase family enzyme
MRGKKVCLVVDLRAGENMTAIPHLVTVFSAAGWKTDIALKEYGGETIQLAKKAAKAKYDLVLGYGGDGTLNAVFNGVMSAGEKTLIADFPGGTYNVWAGAIGVPHDPVKAALAIVNSEARHVDLGHVEVNSLAFPHDGANEQASLHEGKKQKPKRSSKTRQYFLLHVGLGIEAAMMAHISKPLKYHVGPLAFDLAAIKALPQQRPFPIEVQRITDAGTVDLKWQGEVWQVIVSKVPLFGGSVNIEPDARADDGLLSVSLILASNPIKTMEQALSIMLHHTLDEETTKQFRGVHFSIRIPASVDMHVDGSIIKLEELLRKSEQTTLHQIDDASRVMITYQFDAEPRAVQLAIPRTYHGSLFEQSPREEHSQLIPSQQEGERDSGNQQTTPYDEKERRDHQPRMQARQQSLYRMTVVGAVPHPEKKQTFILAGRYKQPRTEETEVLAAIVDIHTLMVNGEGERVSPVFVLEVQEGKEIVVEGVKNKRGVIRASSVRFFDERAE